jgi:L-ribulose-5-phosphate 3-epimerase
MAQCGNWPVGVCSWSLQTDIDGVARAMKELGLTHVHLGIRPALGNEGKPVLAAIQKQKWTISSTMIDFPQEDYSSLDRIRITGGIVPDDCWDRNRDLFFKAVEVTATLGVKFMSMHLGFLDHKNLEHAKKIFDRTRILADCAVKKGLTVLLETGQETAAELQQFLKELRHPAVAVNFDPANMILYDKGDPIEALRVLSPWIRHLHIKDAVRTEKIGTWGSEVPWGTGQVGQRAFLSTLKEVGFSGTMAIEREAGDNRMGDIRQAVTRLAAFK